MEPGPAEAKEGLEPAMVRTSVRLSWPVQKLALISGYPVGCVGKS